MSGVAEFICRSEIETRDRYIKLLEERIVNLEAENPRLRECLEWYADKTHWTIDWVEGSHGDYGNRAREALKELESDERSDEVKNPDSRQGS